MENLYNDIKNLEEVKELIEPDYGKGKEIIQSIDNILNYIKLELEKNEK